MKAISKPKKTLFRPPIKMLRTELETVSFLKYVTAAPHEYFDEDMLVLVLQRLINL